MSMLSISSYVKRLFQKIKSKLRQNSNFFQNSSPINIVKYIRLAKQRPTCSARNNTESCRQFITHYRLTEMTIFSKTCFEDFPPFGRNLARSVSKVSQYLSARTAKRMPRRRLGEQPLYSGKKGMITVDQA